MFFDDFLVNNFHVLSLRARKNDFFHQNNVRNVFSNIELPLGYNIMTLEYVLERTWKEIAKNMWKKSKIGQIRHFLGGYFWNSSMSKSCLEGLIYLVTIVVCSLRPWFQSISTHFEVSVVLIMKLFPHTLWGTQIPWFWALFEPPKIAHIQLQAPVENFLEVVWS